MHQFLPKEREDAQVADTSPACLPCVSKPIFTRNKDLRVCTGTCTCSMEQIRWLWIRSQVTLRIRAKIFVNLQALRSTCCCQPQHWETLRVMYTEAIPVPGKTGQTTGKRWHEKLKGLLLEVVGKAENFLLSTGLALKPFSLLLSADALQRCET